MVAGISSTKIGDAINKVGERVENIITGQDIDPNKDVELLASRGTFDTLPDRLDNSDATKETVVNVDILKGSGWAGQTVKGNADDITERIHQTSSTLKGSGWAGQTVKGNADAISTKNKQERNCI